MSSGFPTRPDRASYGPSFLDVAPVRDARRQVGAGFANLLSHQLAGIGLVVPRVMVSVTVDNGLGSSLLYRAEAWNPAREVTGDQVAPTLTDLGTGLVAVTYPVSIADQEETPVGIAFSWGMGFQSDDPPSVLRHVRVAPSGSTPSEFTIGVFDAAGTLIDGETVTALVW